MNLPDPEPLTMDSPPSPYVLVGDKAFQLTEYLLRPYSRKEWPNEDRNIFNRRLRRARRMIQNTFGILVSQWGILKSPIQCNIDETMAIVQAIVCLHNWLRKRDIGINEYVTPGMVDQDTPDGFIPGSWRKCIGESIFKDTYNCGGFNDSSRKAMEIREEFCQYLNNGNRNFTQKNIRFSNKASLTKSNSTSKTSISFGYEKIARQFEKTEKENRSFGKCYQGIERKDFRTLNN